LISKPSSEIAISYSPKKEMSIILPKELWELAAEEQEQRREVDPWEDALRNVSGDVITLDNGKLERRVLTQELLEINIGIPKERQTNQNLKRIGDCMRQLGWQGPKQMRIGDRNGRGYWRSAEP
jgi:hypothetical protein